jgi:hypothetical protein
MDDLIDSEYFQDYLNTFYYYSINANSTHVYRIINEFKKYHTKNIYILEYYQKMCIFFHKCFSFQKIILKFTDFCK